MARLSQQAILERYEQLAAQRADYTWRNYQPIPLPGYESTASQAGRNCFDRGEAVAKALDGRFASRPLRIIDWGCNLGFFVFQLAKLGHEVVGVDSNASYVDICRFLAETNEFPVKPRFYVDQLTPSSLSNYSGFDVALCFSVLHHLGKEQLLTLRRFAEVYPVALIEMDGRDFGRHHLFPFYFYLEPTVETNDPYGKGTRRRKTWFCSNVTSEGLYVNLKQRNLLAGRSVLKKESAQGTTVIKREELTSRHTWIRTDLRQEQANYARWSGEKYFASLKDFGETDQHRWIEIDYVEHDGQANAESIQEFFSFLERERLFLLDLCADSFLFSRGKLTVVDLESLFPVETTIADLVKTRTRKTEIPFDSYEKQRNHILQRLVG
ncbi:class I SAM-dependent methyltransferase [Planctomicrobium piriforme]|uniref:Methyltransferase domain-containing protein n=1 Tax=Planctomicrobium piriforme TaxID=1576369 RepID=A0A1I3P2V3_9PLAN|nr:class I SAM-dependent methyltransferase [Planctomicrobium piriforme]SFJ15722.1 Methyltransferase domain-containing protein [Planctomicrobium piriforme]